jgi:hypothetical protein
MDAYLTGIYDVRGTEHSERGAAGLTGVTPGPYGARYSGYGGPAGDAGEGTDLSAAALGQRSQGQGGAYTPLPGVLPTKDHLDYVQKFSTAGLLAIGFVLLIALGIINPGRAMNVLSRGAARQAGVS